MANSRIIDNDKYSKQGVKQLSLNEKEYPCPPFSSNDKVNQYFLKSWEIFTQIPFPSKKDEAWRRTPIVDLEINSFLHVPSRNKKNSVTKSFTASNGDDFSGQIRLNSGNTKIIIKSELLDSGVIFEDLQSALEKYPDKLSSMLGSIVPASDGKFAALTSALAGRGAILIVPEGRKLDLPFRITITDPRPNTANYYHIIIWLESGSKTSVMIEHLSTRGNSTEQAMIGDVIEVSVGEGAKLELCEVQALGTEVWSFSHQRARINQEGEINWIFGGFGGHLNKTFVDVDLVGRHANANVGGLFISDGNQLFDFDTQQNHLEAYTKSDLLFKGALKGKSKSVWQGMIHVASNARGADGYQKCSNLILSDTAKASAIPGLEILNNDVKCSHGATISKLSPDELFYLQTRGVSKDEGEKLLLRGFFNQITEMIKVPGNRKLFEQKIDKKLGN